MKPLLHTQLTVVAVALASTALIASAATFSDTSSSQYKEAITGLETRGVVEGYADGTFRPNMAINRAEFLKILMDARYGNAKTPDDLRCFKDLEVTTPAWYARPVCLAKELGIVEGYPDGTFKPEKQVNLVEALKMSLLSFAINPEEEGVEWYTKYVNEAQSRGILTSLLSSPAHLVTRGEMAEIAYRLVIQTEAESSGALCGNGIIESPEQCDDGNTQDSDGCSSICVLVSEPIRIGLLGIDQQKTGVISTIARGQQDVTLVKFTAASNRQNVILTSLTFTALQGSLAYAQHYSLLLDSNNDGSYETTLQAEGKMDSGKLIFEMIGTGAKGIVLQKDRSYSFLVNADLVSTLSPVTLELGFATTLSDYVEAQGAEDGITLTGIETDGSCPSDNCFIVVNTVTGGGVNVVDRGNLYVTEDTTPVRSHILLGGTHTDELMRLRFRAENEDVDVREIRFDGVSTSIDSLRLYAVTPGGTVDLESAPLARASHGQCPSQPTTRFCIEFPLNVFVVPANQELTLVVAADMKTDTMGAVSGQTVTLSIASATDSTNLAVEARGKVSLENLKQNDGSANASGEIYIGKSSPSANAAITGKTHDVSLAEIAAITREGPAQTLAIPTGMTAIGSFRIQAAAHSNSQNGSNNVILQSMTFHVSAIGVELDAASFKLRTQNAADTTLACTGGQTTGSFDVTCSSINSSSVQSRLGSGEFVVYQLQANVTNPAAGTGNRTLYIEIPTLGQRTVTNSITWTDEITTFTWVDLNQTSVQGTIFKN